MPLQIRPPSTGSLRESHRILPDSHRTLPKTHQKLQFSTPAFLSFCHYCIPFTQVLSTDRFACRRPSSFKMQAKEFACSFQDSAECLHLSHPAVFPSKPEADFHDEQELKQPSVKQDRWGGKQGMTSESVLILIWQGSFDLFLCFRTDNRSHMF